MAQGKSETDDLVVCHLDEGSDTLLYALRVSTGFSWTVSLRGIPLNRSLCPLLIACPEQMTSVSDVCQFLEALRTCCLCEGNSDERFLQLSHSRSGRFLDVSGNETCKRLFMYNICIFRDEGSRQGGRCATQECYHPTHRLCCSVALYFNLKTMQPLRVISPHTPFTDISDGKTRR